MSINFEKVLRENLSEGVFSIITSNEKEFADWIQRVRWQSKRCDELYRELKGYKDAEEQGSLLRLPCKVGDTVYRYCEEKGCILEYTVWAVSITAYESGGIEIVIEGCAEGEEEWEDDFSLSLREFKEQFSASREEAEAALAEKGGA